MTAAAETNRAKLAVRECRPSRAEWGRPTTTSDRADASEAYATHCRENYELVTRNLLNVDDVMMDGLAYLVARLAKSVSTIHVGAEYINARPDTALLIEQICDLVDDAIGAPAGRVVRAQARIDGAVGA